MVKTGLSLCFALAQEGKWSQQLNIQLGKKRSELLVKLSGAGLESFPPPLPPKSQGEAQTIRHQASWGGAEEVRPV